MSSSQVPPVTSIGTPRLTAGFDEYGRLDLTADGGEVGEQCVELLVEDITHDRDRTSARWTDGPPAVNGP